MKLLVLTYLSFVITPLWGSLCKGPTMMYHQESNRCFFYKILNGTYYHAMQYCRNQKAQMAIIKSDQLITLLVDYFGNTTLPAWVGATDSHDIYAKRATWTDRSIFRESNLWETYFPKFGGSGKQCIYLNFPTGRLRDAPCVGGKHDGGNGQALCEVIGADDCEARPYKCEDICVITGVATSKCDCRAGFKTLENGTCTDINECHHKNGGCEQKCHNTKGSFECSCWTGTAYQGGRMCQASDKENSLKTAELITILIAVVFPIASVGASVAMILKNRKPTEDKPTPEEEEKEEEKPEEENEKEEDGENKEEGEGAEKEENAEEAA